MKDYKYFLIILFCCQNLPSFAQQKNGAETPPLLQTLLKQPDAATWLAKDTVALGFNTHHTQGMLKIGDYFYLSTVEVHTWPHRYKQPIEGYDRDPGVGTGHLFKFDNAGKLVAQLQLGEADMYHPGGIDFDGKDIWVPVCEYRPYGRSVLYRVDPEKMTAVKAGDCNDAIGAVAFNRQTKELIGMNWDAEHYYRWQWSEKEQLLQLKDKQKNPHRFIHYQDCQYIGNDIMLCSGLRSYTSGDTRLKLGGLQAIRISDHSSLWEIPVPVWVGNNTPLTNNPFFAEITSQGTLLYFIPEDDRSKMYVYEVR